MEDGTGTPADRSHPSSSSRCPPYSGTAWATPSLHSRGSGRRHQDTPRDRRLTSAVGDVAAHAHLLHQLGQHAVLLLCPLPAPQGLAVLLVFLQALEGAAAGLPKPKQTLSLGGHSHAQGCSGHRGGAGAMQATCSCAPVGTASAPHDADRCVQRESRSEKSQ